MMKQLDKNGDGLLDYQEFFGAFAVVDASKIR